MSKIHWRVGGRIMDKDLTICGNHQLGCDCTNWDEYRIDKERKRNNGLHNVYSAGVHRWKDNRDE